jgi:predicted ester cyclase
MGSDSKTVETNKAVTRRFLEEFKNQHVFAVIDELFSPQAAVHLPAEGLPEGPEGQKTIARGIFAAFPDVHVTIDLVIAEGDCVAERHTARATHKGEFMGVPATGRKSTRRKITSTDLRMVESKSCGRNGVFRS